MNSTRNLRSWKTNQNLEIRRFYGSPAFFYKEVFYILHGNLRELISILTHDRKHVELWLSISMLMTAACFFYASFMEITTNFERYLWLGATCACSVVTVFIFGLFLGLTWAKRTLEDAKERD